MKRHFVLLAALAALFLAAATAQAAKTLKIATIAPDGSFWMKTMNEAADEVSKRTDGRVKFKFFAGGVMGNDRSVMRKVRAGQLDGAMFTLGALSEINQDLRIYGIPFLFPSSDAADRARKELDPIMTEGLKKGGFTIYGFAEGGAARFFSKKPVDSIDSMRGRKMWLPEGDTLGQEAMQTMGLSPVSLPITDVLTGLQTGLIEVVANSSIGALALQWHTATSYVTTTPLVYLAATLALKNSSVEELSAADAGVLKEVMERTYKFFDKRNREDEVKAYKALIAEGMKAVDPSTAEVARWRAVANDLAEKMAAKGEFSVDLYRRAVALAKGAPTK